MSEIESAEGLYKRLSRAGLTCWDEIRIIQARDEAVSLRAKREAIVELQQRVLTYTRSGEPLVLALEYAATDMFSSPTSEGKSDG